MIAIRRRVIPAIGQRRQVRATGTERLEACRRLGRRRVLELVGGVLGRRRGGPAKHSGERSYPIRACQPGRRCDSQPVTPHVDGLLDSRRFEHPFVS